MAEGSKGREDRESAHSGSEREPVLQALDAFRPCTVSAVKGTPSLVPPLLAPDFLHSGDIPQFACVCQHTFIHTSATCTCSCTPSYTYTCTYLTHIHERNRCTRIHKHGHTYTHTNAHTQPYAHIGTMNIHRHTHTNKYTCPCCRSVPKSCPTLCNSMNHHAKLLCPSLSPGACSNSCSLSR